MKNILKFVKNIIFIFCKNIILKFIKKKKNK